MQVHKTIQERVNAGAEFLDAEMPGWWNKIDLETLRLSDCVGCVLGQLYGEYDCGSVWLKLTREQEVGLGFDSVGSFDPPRLYPIGLKEDYFDQLQSAWTQLIKERQHGSQEPEEPSEAIEAERVWAREERALCLVD